MALTIVQVCQQASTVVPLYVILTLIVTTKNATLIFTIVDWIPTALTGQNAAMTRHALRGRGIVILIPNVQGHLLAMLTVVQMDHQAWIVVDSIITKVIRTTKETPLNIPIAYYYFTECGGNLTGGQGLFASPNYASNYPISMDCDWVIRFDNIIQPLKNIFCTSPLHLLFQP